MGSGCTKGGEGRGTEWEVGAELGKLGRSEGRGTEWEECRKGVR